MPPGIKPAGRPSESWLSAPDAASAASASKVYPGHEVADTTRVSCDSGGVAPAHAFPCNGLVVFDRDGVLNARAAYRYGPSVIEAVSGAGLAIAAAKRAGYAVGVLSSQSCVGGGHVTEDTVHEVMDRLCELMQAQYLEHVQAKQAAEWRSGEQMELPVDDLSAQAAEQSSDTSAKATPERVAGKKPEATRATTCAKEQ